MTLQRLCALAVLVASATTGCTPPGNQPATVGPAASGAPAATGGPAGAAPGAAGSGSAASGGSLSGPGLPPPTAADCTREAPVLEPEVGAAHLGAYADVSLPSGYNALGSEGEVSARIAKAEADRLTWGCFQRFYPKAVATYRDLRGSAR